MELDSLTFYQYTLFASSCTGFGRVPMSAVTIYHNPACSTSRNVLAMIRDAGIEPTIIEYLKTPPSRSELARLAREAGLSPRGLLRTREPLAAELGLDEATSDDAILDALATHPKLINRPLVVSEAGVRLCRPAELVRDLLPEA
jgi:arsenate reductase